MEDGTDELQDIAVELAKDFAKSSNLVFVNSRKTAEELVVRLHDVVAKARWPHDPFMVHHGSVSKELRGEVEAALKVVCRRRQSAQAPLKWGSISARFEQSGRLTLRGQ